MSDREPPEIFLLDTNEARLRLIKIGELMEDGEEVGEEDKKWVFNLCCYLLDMIVRGEYKLIPKPPRAVATASASP